MKTRRFEHHARQEVWVVEQDGAEYEVRWGPLGGPGQTRRHPCHSAKEATQLIDVLAMQLADLGFTEVGGAASPSALEWNDALEAVVLNDPLSAEARLVYGDWLQLHANPLGDLVALQAAGIVAGDQIDAMFELLFGTVSKNFRTRHSRREGSRGLVLTFENGFIDSVWCGNGSSAEAAAALDGVLSSPASRFVRRITLGLTVQSAEVQTSQPLIDVVIRHAPPLIERLEAADFRFPRDAFGYLHADETLMSQAHAGNFSRVWRALPSLREVVIRGGGEVELGRIEAPHLRALTIQTGGLSPQCFSSIAEASWPALETLNVWCGSAEHGFRTTIGDFSRLLTAVRLPALRHLGVINSRFEGELIECLARSSLLRQLRTLDLSKGTIADSAWATLDANRDAFAHLERIDLSENFIHGPPISGLSLDVSAQRFEGADEGRMPVVGP